MVQLDQITSTLKSHAFVDVLIDTTNMGKLIIHCHLPCAATNDSSATQYKSKLEAVKREQFRDVKDD